MIKTNLFCRALTLQPAGYTIIGRQSSLRSLLGAILNCPIRTDRQSIVSILRGSVNEDLNDTDILVLLISSWRVEYHSRGHDPQCISC